jgi:hypothetical protein
VLSCANGKSTIYSFNRFAGKQGEVTTVMKKNWLAVLSVVCVLFAAVPATAADVFVRIGTSSVGGGFYLIGNTIAQL